MKSLSARVRYSMLTAWYYTGFLDTGKIVKVSKFSCEAGAGIACEFNHVDIAALNEMDTILGLWWNIKTYRYESI